MTILSQISKFLILLYHCHLHHCYLQHHLLQHQFSTFLWYHILSHHVLQHHFLPEKRLIQSVQTAKNWRQRLRKVSKKWQYLEVISNCFFHYYRWNNSRTLAAKQVTSSQNKSQQREWIYVLKLFAQKSMHKIHCKLRCILFSIRIWYW